MELTFDQKYAAVINRDPAFEGIFITGVKSTKIFCRPTCRAKKPLPQNVQFFSSPREALSNGFRPCKLCRPMEHAGEMPEAIRILLQELQEKPELKIKDSDLRCRGIEPSQIRRWFKKNHHLTFQAYQRMLRINNAYQNIKEGEAVTGAAYNSGFNSLSGFNTRFRSVLGTAPSHSEDKAIINIIRIPTPIGPMFGCATQNGICMLEYTDRRMLETEFRDLRRYLNAEILPGRNEHLDKLCEELDKYFDGTLTNFTVPIDAPGTPFQKAVWNLLLTIQYGETRSYKQQAALLGNPLAVRAVASANGCNRISIVIPCHRVIGDNGHLTGYGGGLPRKKWLLDHERNILMKSGG